jgi:sugar (pentulose or hexulose) kinase
VPPTPAVVVPLVDAPAEALADGLVADDLSSTGASVGVDAQPARNAAANTAKTIFFMGPPAE